MCQPGKMSGYAGMSDYSHGRCWYGCGPSFRRFLSAEEQRERLENYRDQLKKELAGVEERIAELGS